MTELRRRTKKSISNEKTDNDSINTKEKSKLSNLPLRVLSRVVVIFSLLTIVYFSSKNDKTITFARQSDILAGKGQIIDCSEKYIKEIDKYEGCFPKECKRFVTDKVISESESLELLQIAKKGLKYGRSSGGASILDLHSGALSKGQHFVNIYKRDDMKNLFTETDFNVFKVVKEKIKYAIAHHFGVLPSKIYLTHPTFFSEINPKNAVTIHDEYWHAHVDKETYKSFHYTTLLYLSNYNKDFEGGRFVFVDEKHNKTVEPRLARLSIFTSGAENLHYVEKVTSGTRYAMTISFTCDKNYAIEDPSTKKYTN
ncbi:PREDICTED: 2-oxoglutarate and iron-dependent oxygenase domain-containing protein 3-like [Papilio xuthus]|uniref:2-oxoglutarate and iron-dependent oxygenase domain-containing protein 3-like n=1 Tax=Papilio xuthus TaxID=66420 RepID=A0AAJ6ZCI6_PAPXU|nr:PREDICTED: 2-oxoglutarate and iron-dependent oxygenase domain-containing protein 3-like [Papilio xuthus]